MADGLSTHSARSVSGHWPTMQKPQGPPAVFATKKRRGNENEKE
jgi:hypothetical protein